MDGLAWRLVSSDLPVPPGKVIKRSGLVIGASHQPYNIPKMIAGAVFEASRQRLNVNMIVLGGQGFSGLCRS